MWPCRVLLALFVANMTFLSGCGSNDGPVIANAKPTFPVSGELVLDGKPAVGVNVMLIPAAEAAEFSGGYMEEGYGGIHTGKTDTVGKFAISTYLLNDGAPAGEYVAAFQRSLKEKDADNPKYRGVAAFNARFRNVGETGVSVTVKDGGSTDLGKIELTSK